MHIHISWMVGLITLLMFASIVGSVNMWARGSKSQLAQGWKLVASPS